MQSDVFKALIYFRESMIKKLSIIVGVLFVISLILISGIHGYLLEASFSLLFLIGFLLTALPVSRRLFRSGPDAVVFAFPIGFVFHALLLSLWGNFFGITRVSFLIYIASTITLCFVLSRTNKGNSAHISENKALQDWQASDTLILFIWLVLTVALVSLPLIHVGLETPKGYAYRAYFNADFFRNMAVVGSLSNSGIPPKNPYFSGVTLHYYWFFYVIPAYWRTLFPSFRLDFMLVQFTLVGISIFVASLIVTLRRFLTSRQTLVWLFPLFAFGGSYKGIYVLYQLHQKHLHFYTFTTWNIEGILRWMWKVPQIDPIFRLLLFGPQHLMALTIFLILISFWSGPRSRIRWILCFLLLYASLGFSVIIGAVLLLGFGLILHYEVVRHFKDEWQRAVTFNVLGLFFLILYRDILQMFLLDSNQIVFSLDSATLKRLPLYLILNWGALFIFGSLGIFWGTKEIPHKRLLFFLTFPFALVFLLKLNLPGASDLSLKFGYLTHILLLFFVVALFDRIIKSSQHPKKWLVPGITIFVAPGLLTWMMDAYNSQDVKNRAFTTYISRQDAALFQWMRENLSHGAVVQKALFGKGYLNQFVTEIPPITGISVFLGDQNLSRMYQIPDEQVTQRQRMVRRLFQGDSPSRIYKTARNFGINYLLIESNSSMQAYEISQQLVEPSFKLVKQEGSAMLFQITRNPPPEMEVEKVLLIEKKRPVLKARFANNFYPPEFHPRTEEPMRWISNDGTILIHSEKELAGKIEFVAYSLGRNREMQLFLNQKLVDQRDVSNQGTEIVAPVYFVRGENLIQIRCPDGPERASDYVMNNDSRLLSFKILRLKFISS